MHCLTRDEQLLSGLRLEDLLAALHAGSWVQDYPELVAVVVRGYLVDLTSHTDLVAPRIPSYVGSPLEPRLQSKP